MAVHAAAAVAAVAGGSGSAQVQVAAAAGATVIQAMSDDLGAAERENWRV